MGSSWKTNDFQPNTNTHTKYHTMFRAVAIVLPLTALSQSAKIARPSFVGQGDVDETLTRSYKNFQEIMDIYLGHFNQNGGSIPNTRTNSENPASSTIFGLTGATVYLCP